jgi:hypothetical protein
MADTDCSYYRGAFRFSDVLESATPELMSTLQQQQSQIQPDDGCNLQFTSVSNSWISCWVVVVHGMLNHHNMPEYFCAS